MATTANGTSRQDRLSGSGIAAANAAPPAAGATPRAGSSGHTGGVDVYGAAPASPANPPEGDGASAPSDKPSGSPASATTPTPTADNPAMPAASRVPDEASARVSSARTRARSTAAPRPRGAGATWHAVSGTEIDVDTFARARCVGRCGRTTPVVRSAPRRATAWAGGGAAGAATGAAGGTQHSATGGPCADARDRIRRVLGRSPGRVALHAAMH